MNNSRFSNLIYRIVGNPDRWHDDYIDLMHQILDETDSFDEPYNFNELKFGDDIISQLKESNRALTAFNTLLDTSRFKMIILDDKLKLIYHNRSAKALFKFIQSPADKSVIKPSLAKQINESPDANENNQNNHLQALEFWDANGAQIYLRSIQSKRENRTSVTQLHILMALDSDTHNAELSTDLIAKFELTEKEQMVVRGLIHGKTIKDIATESFVSDNTVKTHLKSIFRKTNSNSQTSVVGTILTHEAQILDSYFESEIYSTAVPKASNQDKYLTVSNGITICYREYGPSNGRPLLVFHSGYGCRISIPPKYQEICEKTNRRVIIADRPGFGQTEFRNDHIEIWNQCVLELIDALNLHEYDLLGSILGARRALDFVLHTHDKRLKKLILCAPIIINKQAHTKHLTGILNPTARLVRASKCFAKEIYELWLKSITLNLGTHYRSMLETSTGSAEHGSFQDNGTYDVLVEVMREAASLGLEGISNELVHCLTPMKADLTTLPTEIAVWVGTEDRRITVDGVEKVLTNFPTHQLHVCEGYSEHIYYALFEKIIA